MKAERKGENFGKQKRIILLIVLLLVFIISALNMVSAAFYMKPDKIRMHLLYISMFFVIYLIFGNFCRVKLKATYRIFSERKINIIIFFTSILILLLMILGASLGVDFIPRINGAYGWIIIGGISIQPAEFLKIAFIINLANCLSKFENNDKVIEREIIISTALYLLLYAGLIILQRDMGTAIHYFFIWIVMMFYSKIRLFWIKIGVAIEMLILGATLGIGFKIMRKTKNYFYISLYSLILTYTILGVETGILDIQVLVYFIAAIFIYLVYIFRAHYTK